MSWGSSSPPPAQRASRLGFASLVAASALGVLAGLWRVVAAVPLRVPLDPNEGWNAYHAAAAMAGHRLYPPAGSLLTNNYPPLSFYVVGALGGAIGDPIIAGRIVSLLSFLTIAGLIAVLARRFGGSRLEAAFAAAFFGIFLLEFSDYVGMDDPQMLGQVLQIGALFLLFSMRTRWREPVVAALFVTALFVKHNLVALPAAVTLWLIWQERARAIGFAAFLLIFGFPGLLAFRFVFGMNLLPLLASPRSYSASLFAENLHGWLIPAALPLAATLAAACFGGRFAKFCGLYALAGTVLGAVFFGGAGVDANAMFDADIAMALGCAIALGTIGAKAGPLAKPVLALTFLMAPAWALADNFNPDWLERAYWTHPMQEDARIAAGDIAYLRAHPGPAVCQSLGLCYWAGKPASVDVFNLTQQFLTGARSEQPFIAMLARHDFAAVQLDALVPQAFPAPVQTALMKQYRIGRTSDDGVILVPKSGK